MTHSKTFTRSNGDSVKIMVNFPFQDEFDKVVYPVLIVVIDKDGKVSYPYDSVISKAATPEEILEVKRELWLKIEPK